jgi:predicted nucleic acid-binding protein
VSYNYLIDSYAWIEYFKGTSKGKIAKELIENDSCATASLAIAELTEKYKKENRDFESDFNFIISQTKIVDLDAEIALEAGKISFENKKKIKNWGMADSIMLATAKKIGAKVLTGDKHFGNFESVML